MFTDVRLDLPQPRCVPYELRGDRPLVPAGQEFTRGTQPLHNELNGMTLIV